MQLNAYQPEAVLPSTDQRTFGNIYSVYLFVYKQIKGHLVVFIYLFTYLLILRQVSLCDPGWLVLNSTVLLPQPCKSWRELPGLVCSLCGLLQVERNYY